MTKVLMIIPAYNEEESILKTVREITKYKKIKLDYLVINDGSSDETKMVCDSNNIKYVDLVNNLGIGAAVQTGYKYAYDNNYDIAIQFDGDGQHDINYVNDLIDAIVNDKCDMVIGSRFVGDVSKFKSTYFRRVGIKVLSFIIKILTGSEIKDVTSGYRAANKKVIEKFAKNYVFDYPEPITNLQLLKDGYKLKEVAVNMRERQFVQSSIRLFKSVYYMLNVGLMLFIFGIGNGGCK